MPWWKTFAGILIGPSTNIKQQTVGHCWSYGRRSLKVIHNRWCSMVIITKHQGIIEELCRFKGIKGLQWGLGVGFVEIISPVLPVDVV